MTTPNPGRTKELREKMMEHLEAALAIADETQDGSAGYMIEMAMDSIRAKMIPGYMPDYRSGPKRP